jgi:uncharacterized protein with ATP-grasp and redox domains
MRSEQDLRIMYNMIDFKIINNLHREIQELLKHKMLIENRKKKINKLKEKIWTQNGM